MNLVSKNTSNQDSVRSLGGIPLAVELLRWAAHPGSGRALLSVATGLLRGLAEANPLNQEAIGEAGGIDLLLQLIRVSLTAELGMYDFPVDQS